MKTIKHNYGISVKEISENTDIPFGTVQKIFTGETANPRFNTLVNLNEFFVDLSMKYLSEMPQDKMYVHESHRYVPPESSAEELDYFELTLGKRQGEFTVSDRDALPDDIRTELIDGYLYYLAAPNRKHQIIAGMIYAELLAFGSDSVHECLPQIAPVDVNLDDDDKTMLQPDVLVLCHEDRDDRYVHGAPEFVVEIISKSSRRTDTAIKLNKYMNAGVREYWIVDPYNETITAYDFQSDVYPLHYTFNDTVPVSISGGECTIDFRRIKDVLIRQFG
jgi:Uma2 family endonuclease